ncbi:fluoroacetyl-CoA thioesterase [Raineyella antarctica]|uniref:Fluoroacetyl-CoA thioesterase n=1 Tax=Raineyella antarctica TaxID=1577474 RepID=A0A1G6GD07_9ACTN|nr:thioesterase family protein [Raineyella antarctica]SDB79850.1 fluoroacetyl-CoA thioesterase [Raineyella antarctica]
MKPGLAPGQTATVSVEVDDSLTVPAVSAKYPGFAEMPRVFATAYMVGLAECAAMGALADFLEPNESSVGTDVRFDHTAATPVGMTVTATAEVTGVEGRMVSFHVVLRDDDGQIGEGTHQRAIIDKARFEARVAAKAARD